MKRENCYLFATLMSKGEFAGGAETHYIMAQLKRGRG